jgi:hypothetical protein
MVEDEFAAEVAAEIVRQLKDGNGRTTAETRGKTLRELVLEQGEKLDHIQLAVPTFVTRKEMFATLSVLATIVFAALRLLT